MAASTYDRMALRVLLGTGSEQKKQAQLRRLAERARRDAADLATCPECGDDGPHEDNGCRGEDRVFLCRTCRSQFDAVSP